MIARRVLLLCCVTLLTLTGCGGFFFPKERAELDIGGVFFGAEKVEKVYFDFDKYELKEPGKKVLLWLADEMKRDKGISLLVIGHTDSRGTEEYNLVLGEKRANAVREFLLAHDKSLAYRVAVQSRGKAEPEVLVYSSDPEEAERAHAQNRRVVIVLKKQQRGNKGSPVWGVDGGAVTGIESNSGREAPTFSSGGVGDAETLGNSSPELDKVSRDNAADLYDGEEDDGSDLANDSSQPFVDAG